jgi:hypothetical protein
MVNQVSDDHQPDVLIAGCASVPAVISTIRGFACSATWMRSASTP